MPNIILKSVSVSYYNKKNKTTTFALDEVSANFNNSSFNVIIGPSGCGKSTLLRSIAGLIDYDGLITFDGQDIRKIAVNKRNIAYVDQNPVLFPHLTVFDNISYPLKEMGLEREEIIKKTNNILKKFDIEYLSTRLPKQLSIGQIQKISLCKAFIKNPDIFILDEPFSNLDFVLRSELKQLLKQTGIEYNLTIFYVTHDFHEAISMGDYIYYLNNGKILVSGTPEQILASTDESLMEMRRAAYNELI